MVWEASVEPTALLFAKRSQRRIRHAVVSGREVVNGLENVSM